MNSIQQFPRDNQRGSLLRCRLLTDGPREAVAHRLSALAAPVATVDAAQHHWLPGGLNAPQEAQLDKTPGLVAPELRAQLSTWWLADHQTARTPTWDIAATARVGGRPGLLLVEAKAHSAELSSGGKRRDPAASANSQRNHERIAACLQEAKYRLERPPSWLAPEHGIALSACEPLRVVVEARLTWGSGGSGVPGLPPGC